MGVSPKATLGTNPPPHPPRKQGNLRHQKETRCPLQRNRGQLRSFQNPQRCPPSPLHLHLPLMTTMTSKRWFQSSQSLAILPLLLLPSNSMKKAAHMEARWHWTTMATMVRLPTTTASLEKRAMTPTMTRAQGSP